MSIAINGSTLIAGVAGAPVRHSLSPLIQNAWLSAAQINGVYVAFPVAERGLTALIDGFRGGVVRGLNVTLPFKEEALAAADKATDRALAAGAANLLLFKPDGTVEADNTDGFGLIAAFTGQAPGHVLSGSPAVILGAGGAARGAAAALLEIGASEVRLVNRTLDRAKAIQAVLGPRVNVFEWDGLQDAVSGAASLINATSLGLDGGEPLVVSLAGLPTEAVVMDMVYRPLKTTFLRHAESEGFAIVDGLAMLIGQAEPSFEAFFGRSAPVGVDVRGLALDVLKVAK